jgi:hypothetical protein
MRIKNPLNSASVVNYPYGTFLVAAHALGLIVLASPGGEDGSRPERKKILGQIFYCPAYGWGKG